MDFLLTSEELAALQGLPHLQQLTYLRGIRLYMDVKTGIVGIKRRISYQSLAETLYVEPHPGIQSGSPSRQQLRRVIKSLERAGIINVQSDDKHLILKCLLAVSDYSVQNKADTNPTYQADTKPTQNLPLESSSIEVIHTKADIALPSKADIPLSNGYLYILFEKFWESYPEKKSKIKAQAIFEQLNPDPTLFQKLMQALQNQIHHAETMKMRGAWVAPWKYPANCMNTIFRRFDLTRILCYQG